MNREDYKLTISKPNNRSAFTMKTMDAIAATRKKPIRVPLFTIHKPAFLVLLLLLAFSVPAAAYAITHWLNVTNKGKNQAGRQEYNITDADQCSIPWYGLNYSRFELRKDAPAMDDEEVRKIAQASCELRLAVKMADSRWATPMEKRVPGPNVKIFMTLPGSVGVIKNVSGASVTLRIKESSGFGETFTHKSYPGKSIEYYDITGKKLHSLKDGDVVTAVTLEQYPLDGKPPDPRSNISGVIALYRLSFPIEYYSTKQAYLMELPECYNNPGEYCPNGSMIDVYPRTGEQENVGSTKAFENYDDKTMIMREISGTVKEFEPNKLVIQSRSKHETYTITLDSPVFEAFNATQRKYNQNDLQLLVGDEVKVSYYDMKAKSTKTITPENLAFVNLLLAGNPKVEQVVKYNQ